MKEAATKNLNESDLASMKDLFSKLSKTDQKSVVADYKKTKDYFNVSVKKITIYTTTGLTAKGNGKTYTLETPISLENIAQKEVHEAVKKAAENRILKEYKSFKVNPLKLTIFKATFNKEGNTANTRVIGVANSSLVATDQIGMHLPVKKVTKH